MATKSVGVTIHGTGTPGRSMGWYHAKQFLEKRVPGAQLVSIIEPFFKGPGANTEAGKIFAQWALELEAEGVAVHEVMADVPMPSGPHLLYLCGRTRDNPRIFREAVERGYTHIFLEKPGAPSAKELEDMSALAHARGTHVYMGFNRNFSKYVSETAEHMKKAPVGAQVSFRTHDIWNTDELLDRCFESNSEGMLKNMMIHDIVAMITFFGLKSDKILDIVPDTSSTRVETRKGYTDLSAMACRIYQNDDREFYLEGKRTGGDYAEAVVSADGRELFKSIRPDAEVHAHSAALEEAEPGYQSYFYFQDLEYLAMKEIIVERIVNGETARADGLAGIEIAIDGLKICEKITDAINQTVQE